MKKRCTLELNSKDLIKAEIEVIRKLIKKQVVDKTDKSLCKYVMKFSDDILKAAKEQITNHKCYSNCNKCPFYK